MLIIKYNDALCLWDNLGIHIKCYPILNCFDKKPMYEVDPYRELMQFRDVIKREKVLMLEN